MCAGQLRAAGSCPQDNSANGRWGTGCGALEKLLGVLTCSRSSRPQLTPHNWKGVHWLLVSTFSLAKLLCDRAGLCLGTGQTQGLLE